MPATGERAREPVHRRQRLGADPVEAPPTPYPRDPGAWSCEPAFGSYPEAV
ncbi:hypothetical protein GCM10009603_09160 [Nocardiopsis exhalans]